jgi:uncharacterized protein YdaU (DUF1376 family)
MSRRPYFKFYFEDFWAGIRKAGMTPEEVGMYVMSLGFQWQDGGRTKADPVMLGMRTGWGTKVARRLTAQLVNKDKLIEADGYLSNPRMEREIVAFVNLKKAALEREKAKREAATKPLRSDFVAGSCATRAPDEIDLFAEKPNEINETSSTTEARKVHISESRIQNPEKEEIKRKIESPLPPTGEALSERGAINRQSALAAFQRWQGFAKRVGLPIPRDTSFETYGKKIAQRMYQHAEGAKGEAEMLAVWDLALAMVERSKFLRGMTKATFKADLKFLCQRESFDKLISGGYGNGAHAQVAPPSGNGPPRASVAEQLAELTRKMDEERAERRAQEQMIEFPVLDDQPF